MVSVSENIIAEGAAENKRLLQNGDKCDQYDYLIAAGCGAIGGIIDIFLVGAPGDSVLGKWTDQQIDNTVMAFSKKMGWKPRAGQENNVRSAIGFLERNFKVNYDQAKGADVGNLFKMNTKNHHMMSLAHSPDIVGLFFSVLNQFTSTSTFLANGQLITIQTETHELYGSNLVSKLFCGITNWFGHVMSDIAGSSGSKIRGTGVVMPFYELFGLCKFGRFRVEKDLQDLATIATRAFQNGYDFRFGLATAIPVAVTELTIRLIWSIKRYFYHHEPLGECIPTDKHQDLRIMLLIGHGTLCAMDGADAVIRSGGDCFLFFTRMNWFAWTRFTMLVVTEVCIRIGIKNPLQMDLNVYKQITVALHTYLEKLQRIDFELFKQETEKYNQTVYMITKDSSPKQLNRILLNSFEELGIPLPWENHDSFQELMEDKNAHLVFK